jgi:phage tail-like protein
MDVNNTKYHVLLGRPDWQPLISAGDHLVWEATRSSVALQDLLFRFKTSPRDLPPELANRRGAGRDRFGHWYWISADGAEIRKLPAGARRSVHYWSAGEIATDQTAPTGGNFRPVAPPPPETLQFRGLAVTEHHYLVVGVLNPAGLLAFDLHAGGPPRWLLWPEEVPFVPFDMAPAPGGGLVVLDGGEAPRYWVLDCNLDVVNAAQALVPVEPPVPAEFQPVDPDAPAESRERRQFPAGIVPGLASPLDLVQPIAIEALPDGSVLVLDAGPEGAHSTIHRFHMGEPVGVPYGLIIPGERLEENPDGTPAPDQNLRGYDLAFSPFTSSDPTIVTGTAFVTATDGNQTFAFTLYGDGGSTDYELELRYLPMRKFGGKGLVAADDGQVYYDYADQWIPLTDQSRPRYEPAGTLTTGALDGKEPDCIWHRLFLDACLPNGTAIAVESRAADDPTLLKELPWQLEPVPYLRSRGAEVPYHRPFSPEEAGVEGTGTWELLLQAARGRYLELRLTLTGTGRNTPRIRALRVYYPRFSYLKEYLPGIYRQDPLSASFLERFLANPEGQLTALEDRIAQAQVLLDIRTVPASYLDWLAGWFGALLDPAWDELRRRLFIAHAPELFRQRGTVPGLIRSIRLAIDPCPDESLFTEDVTVGSIHSVRIVEGFLTRRAPGVVFGDPSTTGGPGVTTDLIQWRPEMGAVFIHQRYRAFLAARYGVDPATLQNVEFPPVMPVCAATEEVEAWRDFLRFGLGFTYAAVEPADDDRYREFLARRYRRVAELNRAYELTGTAAYATFGAIPLPETLPASGRPLYDWIQFASVYLPTVRISHHFTVMIPTRAYAGEQVTLPNLEVVRRIIELEKPGHTRFEVKEYWAMFRVGEARLGLDTYLEYGSRLAAIALGSRHVGQGYLAAPHPWDVPDRKVVGRDRIQ